MIKPTLDKEILDDSRKEIGVVVYNGIDKGNPCRDMLVKLPKIEGGKYIPKLSIKESDTSSLTNSYHDTLAFKTRFV